MKKQQLFIILTILFFIVGTFVCYYFYVIYRFDSWQTRGQVGDSFGFLNAFFSALAIIGIVYTVLQQNETISQNKLSTDNSIKEFNEKIKQYDQQQQIQSLTTLINIYERKLEQYKLINETNLIIETERKLVNLITDLENYLTK